MTYQVIVSDSGTDVATFEADTLTEACESATTWFAGAAVSFRPGTQSPDCVGCGGTVEPLNADGYCGTCVSLDSWVDEHGTSMTWPGPDLAHTARSRMVAGLIMERTVGR